MYDRVSGTNQKSGLESQRAILLSGLTSEIELVRDEAVDNDVFEDFGEFSGTADRPSLNRLREVIRGGKVDQVRVVDRDRLMRVASEEEEIEYLELRMEMRRAGVVLADAYGRPYSKGNSAEDDFTERLLTLVAGLERRIIRRRSMERKVEHRKAGRVMSPGNFYWMRWEPASKGWQLLENEVAIVQQIARWILEGVSLQGIADRLNLAGHRAARGGIWRASSLLLMMRNRALIGEYVQHKYVTVEPIKRRRPGSHAKTLRKRSADEWLVSPCPRVLSDEVFAEMSRRFELNRKFARRNAKREYLLSGLLRCSICGRPWTAFASGEHKQYWCKGRSKANYLPGEPCPTPAVSIDRVEPTIWQAVEAVLLSEDVIVKLKRLQEKPPEHYEAISREIEDIDRRHLPRLQRERDIVLDSRRKLPELYTIELTAAEMAKVQKEEAVWNARRQELAEQLEQRRLSEAQLADATRWIEVARANLSEATFQQRRQLVQVLIDRIWFDGRQLRWRFTIPTLGEPVVLDQAAVVAVNRHGPKPR